MGRFYFLLWLRWALRITVCSVAFSVLFSSFVTTVTYLSYDTPSLNSELIEAVFDIFVFWVALFWPLALLLSLFRSLKYVFNVCLGGFELKLLTCDAQDTIDIIGYGDLLKVWRKWLMLLVWIVGSLMILAVFATKLFMPYDSIFEWFNAYWLYAFIVAGGYAAFVLMITKCKKIKAIVC